MAEILAKKLKRGWGEAKLAERIHGQIFCKILLEVAEKGPNKFSYEVPYFTLMTNTQTKKKFNFHFLLTLQMNAALMFL
jgi:hypothetical protein